MNVIVLLLVVWIFWTCLCYVKEKMKSTKKLEKSSAPSRQKWAIFTQVHKPQEFSKWLDWHLNLHPHKIWVTVENDPYLKVMKDPRVIVQYKNPTGGSSWGTDLDDRKSANFNQAAEQLRREGVEWMLTLDDDELLWVNTGRPMDVLNKYPNDDCLVMKNYEAVFKNINEQGKCFAPDTRFVDCNKGKCLGYTNGKSWGRIQQPGVQQHGAHRFKDQRGKCVKDRYIPSTEMCILHYESCNFDKWMDKFKKLSKDMSSQINFTNFKGTQEEYLKKVFPYYYKSIKQIGDIKDENKLKEFYKTHKTQQWANAKQIII